MASIPSRFYAQPQADIGLGGAVRAIVLRVGGWIAMRRPERRSPPLGSLSDHTLRDLGLRRDDLRAFRE